jgi:hypothetical protein
VVREKRLDLKTVINALKEGRTTDWALDEYAEIDGKLLHTKLEFSCNLRWQKVKLHDIDGREFLSFAKQDLEEDSDRGRVNALSNAKRAIECRMDEILKLFNLWSFCSRQGLNLPQKLLFLRTKLGITAPDILKNLITSKRNILEHEYIRPERQEVRNCVDLTELFLKATDREVERGYMASAIVSRTKWFPNQLELDKFPYDNIVGYQDKYELIFDLDEERLTLKYSTAECFREFTEGTLREWSAPLGEEKPITISIRDCTMEDVRELMMLLREKGK